MFGTALPADTIIAVLGALVIGLTIWLIRTEVRLRKFMRGQKAQSLESIVTGALADIGDLRSFQKDMMRYCEHVEKRLRSSIRGIGNVRFDAFAGTGAGGKQSFAAAFLTEDGDGIVLSSLFSRDRMSVFAKPIERHKAASELTIEEQDALTAASESCKV